MCAPGYICFLCLTVFHGCCAMAGCSETANVARAADLGSSPDEGTSGGTDAAGTDSGSLDGPPARSDAAALRDSGADDAAGDCVKKWPLGHHGFSFRHDDGSLETSSGWDPAYRTSESAEKKALVAGIPTYPVGLRNGAKPGDLANTWSSNELSATTLAGKPKISLSGVGDVYLLASHDARSAGLVRVRTKVALVNCAFDSLEVDDSQGGDPEVWIVDSLIDAAPQIPAPVRAWDGPAHIMYSELLGGDDSSKVHSGSALYRSHMHGADKEAAEHSDGMQFTGGGPALLYENTFDFLFRMTNGCLWISDQSVAHDLDVVGNLLSGGHMLVKLGEKGGGYANNRLWGNRGVGTDGSTSWSLPGFGSSTPFAASAYGKTVWDVRDDNVMWDGTTSGKDQLGRSWSTSAVNGVPPAAGDLVRVQTQVLELETWAHEIRAAAGFPATSPYDCP